MLPVPRQQQPGLAGHVVEAVAYALLVVQRPPCKPARATSDAHSQSSHAFAEPGPPPPRSAIFWHTCVWAQPKESSIDRSVSQFANIGIVIE